MHSHLRESSRTEKIKHLLQLDIWTQQQIADHFGINQSHVCRLKKVCFSPTLCRGRPKKVDEATVAQVIAKVKSELKEGELNSAGLVTRYVRYLTILINDCL